MASLPRKSSQLKSGFVGVTARALVLASVAFPLAACGGTTSLPASLTATNDKSATVNAASLNLTGASSSAAAAAVGAPQGSYADVISRVAPAVVTINSTGKARTENNPMLDDPMLREFFGGRIPRSQPRRSRGLGSGIIVTKDGYILTNNHVVDDADKVTVTLNDNRTFDAKVIGTDAASDLAVIKIDAKDLPVLPLGNSDAVRVGDVALAIGNPLGVGQTVTSGIISAKGRSTGAGSAESFEDFIQTDAPINQGNSGGALINTSGELVGINSQILSPSGGNIGIGFAIPSNMAKNVMDQLVKNGKVRRGFLGVSLQPITSDLAASFKLSEPRGALAAQVEAGSPAERAGLKRGDVITAINGTSVTDTNSLRNRIAATQPGEQVSLTVLRNGAEQKIQATLGERPTQIARNEDGTPRGAEDNATPETNKLGLAVEPLTPELARQLEVKQGAQGLVVSEVAPDSPAADAGLRKGDIIEEVNGQQVRAASDIRTAIDRSQGRPVLMLINRGGSTAYVPVRPQQG